MTRVNVDILGISELKWTEMGEFNSDDHYIYSCGQESLRRNGVAIIVNKKSRKCSTWMQSQKWQNDPCSFPRQTIQYYSNPSLCPDLLPPTVEVRNRFKGLDLIDRVPDEQWMEVRDIVQEIGIKTTPKKKFKKAKWLSEEALQIAVKRREAKSKGESESVMYVSSFHLRILFFPFLMISRSWGLNCVFRLICIDRWWEEKDTCCVSAFSCFSLNIDPFQSVHASFFYGQSGD